MTLPLKESRAASEMAKILYDFLPGSGWKRWKGHVSFQTIAESVGVGDFWQTGSKEPAIAALLERTLEHRRHLFEKLILGIVRAAIKYRQKNKSPIRPEEIRVLNGLILEVGFKFPDLWDPDFHASLVIDGSTRARQMVEREERAEQLAVGLQQESMKRREYLRGQFYALCSASDRQAAGLALENVLNQLFQLSDLSPRKPFRVAGEQIDGSFDLDGEIYLLEAKWEAGALPEAPLLIFRGKVEGKSQFTRGVFVALNGITPDALLAITQGKQPNFFLMDGYDLTIVLEGRMPLDDLLRAKLRLLAEEGRVFVSAKELE